jgi:hypothetical protein
MDPRVKVPSSAVDQQFKLSMRLYEAMNRTHDRLRMAAGADGPAAGSQSAGVARALSLYRQLTEIYNVIQGADAMPSSQAMRQAEELLQEADGLGDL